jgi:hypothetical protein
MTYDDGNGDGDEKTKNCKEVSEELSKLYSKKETMNLAAGSWTAALLPLIVLFMSSGR